MTKTEPLPQPTDDHILVEDTERAITEGGIHLPEDRRIVMHRAVVRAVGPGAWNKKRTARKPLSVKPGDTVFYLAMNSMPAGDRWPNHYWLAHDNIQGFVEGEDGPEVELVGRYTVKEHR